MTTIDWKRDYSEEPIRDESGWNASEVDADSPAYRFCSDTIPTTAELFRHLPPEGYVFAGVLTLFTVITLVIYLEEICFIRQRFRNASRTVWVLACFPVFSLTGLLGAIVPKSGTVIDLMANAFFATCMYNFGFLMVNYMGGTRRMWSVMNPGRQIKLTAPPCGFFCCCVGPVDFNRSVFMKIRLLVMQVAIVRPILMFFAVVLWANGSFHPGIFKLNNAFTYIVVGNVISTMTAVYGLMLFKNTFQPELGTRFLIVGKVICVQLTLLSSIIPNVIISILVNANVITCGPLFPSKARGESIYHGCLVLLMLPLSLLAQRFFRRAVDSIDCGQELKQHATWVATLKLIDSKHWLSLGESKV